GGINAIEAGKLDRDIVATDFLDVPGLEGTHTAVLAEQVCALATAEAVITERLLAGQQAKLMRLDHRAPVARLGANRAIALARALREVDVGFEADGAAVTAAVVCPFHADLRQFD